MMVVLRLLLPIHEAGRLTAVPDDLLPPLLVHLVEPDIYTVVGEPYKGKKTKKKVIQLDPIGESAPDAQTSRKEITGGDDDVGLFRFIISILHPIHI